MLCIVGMALLASSFWPFELLTHYVVYYAVFLALLALTSLFLKQFKLLIIIIILLAYQLFQIYPYIPFNQHEEGEIKLLSHNFSRHNENFDALKTLITEENPDIFLIMEVADELAEELESYSNDYPYYYIADERGVFGMAMLSKYPAEFAEFSFDEPVYIDASVTIKDNLVRVIGFHPYPPINTYTAISRNENISNLTEYIKEIEEPLIVMGDFNMSMWSPYFKNFIKETGLNDTRIGFGVNPTWSAQSWWLSIPIDHILVSDGLSVINFYKTEKTGSDHIPVVAEISL